MKKTFLIIVIVVLVEVGFVLWQKSGPKDPKNISYMVDGRTITLKNGVAELTLTPGSATKLVVRYFGNESTGDLNLDGMPDTAFILTQNGGGSGTFYYAVAALKTEKGYTGTNAVFLGDRIAPQTTEIKNGQIIANYADRKPGQPMTAKPTVGVSKYFKLSGTELVEVDSHDDLIRADILPGTIIKSPLTVTGTARGNWYFEASFPVRLLDGNGKEIAAAPAQAQGEWMTTEFVPFSVKLTFVKPTTKTGTLVLEKDNASGLPEHDDSISIPVIFPTNF